LLHRSRSSAARLAHLLIALSKNSAIEAVVVLPVISFLFSILTLLILNRCEPRANDNHDFTDRQIIYRSSGISFKTSGQANSSPNPRFIACVRETARRVIAAPVALLVRRGPLLNENAESASSRPTIKTTGTQALCRVSGQ
jgi:hypothetical protein